MHSLQDPLLDPRSRQSPESTPANLTVAVRVYTCLCGIAIILLAFMQFFNLSRKTEWNKMQDQETTWDRLRESLSTLIHVAAMSIFQLGMGSIVLGNVLGVGCVRRYFGFLDLVCGKAVFLFVGGVFIASADATYKQTELLEVAPIAVGALVMSASLLQLGVLTCCTKSLAPREALAPIELPVVQHQPAADPSAANPFSDDASTLPSGGATATDDNPFVDNQHLGPTGRSTFY